MAGRKFNTAKTVMLPKCERKQSPKSNSAVLTDLPYKPRSTAEAKLPLNAMTHVLHS